MKMIPYKVLGQLTPTSKDLFYLVFFIRTALLIVYNQKSTNEPNNLLNNLILSRRYEPPRALQGISSYSDFHSTTDRIFLMASSLGFKITVIGNRSTSSFLEIDLS